MFGVKNRFGNVKYQTDPINQITFLSERRILFKNLHPNIILAFLLCSFIFLFSQSVFAQEDYDKPPEDLVPPPLNVVTDDLLEQLDKQTKMKKRAKLSLKLMDSRLTKSEDLLDQNNYQESLTELGIFQGLLIDSLKYLKLNKDSKGVLKHYKKLEMNLRDFLPRLELLRRNLPYKYGYHVKHLIFYVRDARTRALKPLFDDTVLPEIDNQ